MKSVLLLGSSGMLGSMVLSFLSGKGFRVDNPSSDLPLDIVLYDAPAYDYIINCMGIIKQKLTSVKEAIEINALFPYQLSEAAPEAKIIQIATDCVYNGHSGLYRESHPHNATDVYGKTKSLGEVSAANFCNVRTSIVGPDKRSNASLLQWFLSQDKDSKINGFSNHFWNGVTTLHFAKLCHSVIKNNIDLPGTFHFVPADVVSKYKLLEIFADKFDRKDISIQKTEDVSSINRTLDTEVMFETNGPSVSTVLWRDMGYQNPPTIEEMVGELAEYVKERNFYQL